MESSYGSGMALKSRAQADRKCTVNKGSEVKAHRPPSNGLAVDQVRLSDSSRVSSRIPLRTQSANHRSGGTKKKNRANWNHETQYRTLYWSSHPPHERIRKLASDAMKLEMEERKNVKNMNESFKF